MALWGLPRVGAAPPFVLRSAIFAHFREQQAPARRVGGCHGTWRRGRCQAACALAVRAGLRALRAVRVRALRARAR